MNTLTLNFPINPLSYITIPIRWSPHTITVLLAILPLAIIELPIRPQELTSSLSFAILTKRPNIFSGLVNFYSFDFLPIFVPPFIKIIVLDCDSKIGFAVVNYLAKVKVFVFV